MKQLSKERLEEIRDYDTCVTLKESEAMARAILAGISQDPVAWLLSGGGTKNVVVFDSGNAYADPLREVTPLYAAPPAPVVADAWIPCSERMPEPKTGVLLCCRWGRDFAMKWGTYAPGHPEEKNGWIIPGASWEPTHWQPLPAPPKDGK